MYCKCGNNKEMKSGTHEVTSIAGAKEWWADVSPIHLPIKVQSYECDRCGRYGFKLFSDNQIVYRKGV